MWKIRLAGYIAGFLGVAATLAAAFGYGTYDPATGMYDPPPFNVTDLGGLIVAGVAQIVAALAVVRGWRAR